MTQVVTMAVGTWCCADCSEIGWAWDRAAASSKLVEHVKTTHGMVKADLGISSSHHVYLIGFDRLDLRAQMDEAVAAVQGSLAGGIPKL